MATPLSNYTYALEPVLLADADCLARAVDAPASQCTPLFRVMFPDSGVDFSEQQNNEIIRWHAEGIKDAVMGGRTHLRKVRQGDGTLVGLARWVPEGCPDKQAKSNDNHAAVEVTGAETNQKSKNWLPGAPDVSTWLELSTALKKERQRVIGHLDNVCRMPYPTRGLMVFRRSLVPTHDRNNDHVHLSRVPTPRTRVFANATYC